jgi:hypothetical protein
MGIKSRGALFSTLSKSAVVTLVLATVLAGSARAQDPQAVEARDSSAADTRRSVEATGRLAGHSTTEPVGADLRERPAAAPDGRTRPARKLTVRQKRIFVLGLWAGEKN